MSLGSSPLALRVALSANFAIFIALFANAFLQSDGTLTPSRPAILDVASLIAYAFGLVGLWLKPRWGRIVFATALLLLLANEGAGDMTRVQLLLEHLFYLTGGVVFALAFFRLPHTVETAKEVFS